MDKLSPVLRSRNMSRIRGKNTEPERYLRHLLYHKGLRYRINFKELKGRPDIYISRYNTAVFVNGCFWHRHENCRFSTIPKSNTEFWEAKFSRNISRDEITYETLIEKGLKVIVVWECTIQKMKKDEEYQRQILEDMLTEIMTVNGGLREF